MMHPAIIRFEERFRREAKERGSYRSQLGPLELAFLERVWGPAFEYDFSGLTAEYPFKDFKSGDRFIDFRFNDGVRKTMIELDGFTTHARNISPGEFDDHLERQNDLLLQGWFLLRFSRSMVMNKAEVCQRQLMHAMGKWHYLRGGSVVWREDEKWSNRRAMVLRTAIRCGGSVRPIDVALALGISRQTAVLWLRRFVMEGTFVAGVGNGRVNRYFLPEETTK
jgi:hypothetical protein